MIVGIIFVAVVNARHRRFSEVKDAKMKHADVIAILTANAVPEDKILLDDGEYFIEHNVNYPLERGNGFLMKRRPVSRTFPGGEEAIGGYDLKLDGKWQADVSAPWDEKTDSDCRSLGKFAGRLDAIATLWLARAEAFSR